MLILQESEAINLGLVGAFNPAIFTPHWFSHNGLITLSDAESSTIEVIHRDVSIFQTSWFSFYSDQEQLQITPIDPISIRVFDLVLRLFGETLPHTPLKAIGINYMCHFKVPSVATLHAFGDAIAPKGPWGAFGAETMKHAPENAMLSGRLAAGRAQKQGRAGGLASMTMVQHSRHDGRRGFRQAKVEPSTRHQPGLYVETNDHYGIATGMTPNGATLTAAVEGVFDESVSWSKSVTNDLMALSQAVDS